MGNRSATEILIELYDWANAEQVLESETGEHISFEDYKAIIADDISELAYLLGIDLEERSN